MADTLVLKSSSRFLLVEPDRHEASSWMSSPQHVCPKMLVHIKQTHSYIEAHVGKSGDE